MARLAMRAIMLLQQQAGWTGGGYADHDEMREHPRTRAMWGHMEESFPLGQMAIIRVAYAIVAQTVLLLPTCCCECNGGWFLSSRGELDYCRKRTRSKDISPSLNHGGNAKQAFSMCHFCKGRSTCLGLDYFSRSINPRKNTCDVCIGSINCRDPARKERGFLPFSRVYQEIHGWKVNSLQIGKFCVLFGLLALRFARKHDLFHSCLNAHSEAVEASCAVNVPHCCSILSTEDIETHRAICGGLPCSSVPMGSLVRHDSNSSRYSWWWVSHISPKNSKWLQENLTDMDVMVKAMIKLINEDADSFARRAEMYYKKRPELMKQVEEFYRAYRALAERYDQATVALRQAHRTMSEEFPNQMPSMSEESPSSHELEPRTPEMPPIRAPFDLDDLHKDALGVSPHLFTVKRNGTHPDEISSLSSRKGLKQFNDLFASSDNAHRVNFSDGKVRKGLSFESPDAKAKEVVGDDTLQQKISKLLAESQSLKQQISSESQRANNAESESQSLKDTISCLISEKDTALLQYSESTKRSSVLESELSKAHNELKKLSDYMAMEVEKLNCAESRNNKMQSELETLGQKVRVQEQEVAQSRKEMESFHFNLQDESARRIQAEDTLSAIEKEYTQSQEEAYRLAVEMEAANDRLSEFKQVKLNLESTVCELKNEVVKLTEQNRFSELLIKELRADIDSLVDSKCKIESEIQALMATITQINTEKDVALLQHRQCVEEVSYLELKLSKAQSELEKIELKVQMLEQELKQKREAADAIHARLQDEHFNHMQKEAALLAMEDLHSQSQEEAKRLAQNLEHSNKKLSDLEHKNSKLYDMSQGLERMVSDLNSEKDAALLQQQKSLERISCLEAQLLLAQLEMEKIVIEARMLEQELVHKNNEVGNLQSSLQKEGQKCMLAETDFLRVEHLHLQSQEEAQTLAQNLDILSKKLNDVNNDRLDLQNIARELKNTISEMNSEKDAVLFQQQQSLERVSYLEAQLFDVQSELEKNKRKVQLLQKELKHKKEEVKNFRNNLEEEGHKRMHAEAELTVVENLHSKSQEELGKLVMDLEKLNNELNEVQESKLSMEELSCELRNTISLLNTEKDASLLRQKLSLERLSDLQSEFSKTQLELEKTGHKVLMLEQELAQKNSMVDFLQSSLQDEGKKRVQAETLLITNENLYSQSQEEVSRLALEIQMVNKKLNEVDNLSTELKTTIFLLNSEKDTTILQHKQSLVRTSDLESKLSEVQAELKSAEQKVRILDKEVKQKREEVDSLQSSLQDESWKRTEGEAALLALTNVHSHSQEEVNRLALEINSLNRKLNEVETMSSELKNTILLLNSEKDTTILQHKQSLLRVSDLESKLFDVQSRLENAEQNVQMLDKGLEEKRGEVNTLQTNLKHEAQKHIEGEAALLVMTNLHSQSQKEVSGLLLKIDTLNGKLNVMENSKMDFEKMISKHAIDNHMLREQILSSELTIRGLHDELNMLQEIKVNLENEVGIHIGGKEMLQQQLDCQKKDKEILEKQYCSLEHEMDAVNARAASLQQLLEEKVCDMEKLSEEYLILKKSFSNAIVEVEALKEIVKDLEASESSLKYDVSLHSSEKDALALELHILHNKYVDISEKKSILETSFSDVNSELGELRVKSKDVEELSQSYLANNRALLAEKDNILSQLESTMLAMKSLEGKHADLGDKHLSLLEEKDLLYGQLGNLRDRLGIKNEQHEALLRLHQIQVNEFEGIVSSLQEKICHMNQMLDQEQKECTYASIGELILTNSLADAEDKFFYLFTECQKFIQATHSAEVLITRLEEEAKNKEEEKKKLLKHNKELRDVISQQIKILDICKDLEPPGVFHDEIMLQTLSRETFNHVKHKEDSEHRNVFMDAELSVLGTILTQIVIDFRDLHWQKCELEKEVETGAAELVSERNKNHKLIELNEQLRQRLQQGSEREETLNIKVLGSYSEISRLRESNQNSQKEICNLAEKYESLLQEYELLVEKYKALDEENTGVLAQCIMLDHLSLFFTDRSNESLSALISLNNDMATLGSVKHELDGEVRLWSKRAKVLEVHCKHLKDTLENLVEVLGIRLVLLEFDSNTSKNVCQELAIDLKGVMGQLMQKDDKLCKADEKTQFLQETNQGLWRVLRDLEASVEDAKGVEGELEKKITALTERGDVRDNEYFLLSEENMALRGEVDIHKQKGESLTSRLEMAREEAEQHEREIVSLASDMITYSLNAMIYEEQVLELMMECESLEIRMITERETLMKEICSRDAYVDEMHKRIASMGGENAELKAELSTCMLLVASLSDHISVLEEGTLLLSELNKEGKLEFMQEGKHGSESHDYTSGPLELQSLITRVEALRVVMLEAKDRQEKEFTESAAKLEAANIEIQDLKTKKGSCTRRKEQYMEDDRQKYDADNSKGKHIQIMKDIELDQVSTCSPYGTGATVYPAGATVYPLGSDANAELGDEMLQLWETAEKDCKSQTAKSSSSEHDIQAVEEMKSEYPSFELARGRGLGFDRLEISTASLEPQQLWSKNVLEKLATDAQGLSITQASIEEVKQKIEGTSKGKSPFSSEYSSIRAQLQEIEVSLLEQIDFNNNLTKKAENYPAFEVSAELEGYSSRRKISEQVQKGSEKVARLDLELQKIQYILLKIEEEHAYKRVKVSEKRPRLLLRDYMHGRKDKNDGGQKKKNRLPFCGCVRPNTRTEP